MTSVSYEALQRRKVDWAAVLASLGPMLGLIIVVVLFSLLRPRTFLTIDNLQIMLVQTAVVGTAALGMTMIIVSGGIDLSVGSTIALVTVVVALLLKAKVWAIGAAAGGVASAALVGLTIGLLVTQLRLPPFIATLGLWGAVRGIAKGLADERTVVAPGSGLDRIMEYKNITAAYPQADSVAEAFRVLLSNLYHAIVSGKIVGLFSHGVWIMLVLAVIVWAMLRYTRFGRHVFAIGSNEQTARLCGVRVQTSKVMIYMIAGALAGVAGVLQFSFLTLGDPTTANGMELNIIAAVVIGGASLSGGQGTIFGTMMGALMMTAIASGCNKMEWKNWQQEIITGGIILLASALDQLRQRRGT
jgi:ribose/xylose/arabinose/galactoside ABC-type transport system permease subunit